MLGVYPSALHVRWTPPQWAGAELGVGAIGALAVDDEPVVFWDGGDAAARAAAWRLAVRFRAGDGPHDWGHVSAAGNGTSGRAVGQRVLAPLEVGADATWFTDAVDRYFVKSGGLRRQQSEAIAADYAPFAAHAGLPAAVLPARPSVADLVALAATEHQARLRHELQEARAPTVVTLGEEARRVFHAIADESSGQPTLPLDGRQLAGKAGSVYGKAGEARVGSHRMVWRALVHPGQRSATWTALHDRWIERLAAAR